MTDNGSTGQRPLPKFSNVDRNTYWRLLAEEEAQPKSLQWPPAGKLPLCEALIASSAPSPGFEAANSLEPLPGRLLEELSMVRDRSWRDPVRDAIEAPSGHPAPPPGSPAAVLTGESKPGIAKNTPSFRGRAQMHLLTHVRAARIFFVGGARSGIRAFGQSARRMTLRDWRRRYLALLSVVHRYILDRGVERLLFLKTPPLKVYEVVETETPTRRISFVYNGPIPRKVLNWALSVLPSTSKRYAFVDFRAGNGRTLLLASRRDFDYAAGYVYDNQSAEVLEMNLSQYPRSYMGCRDVRALRGDRHGIEIPAQPAVLFFPESIPESHLGIILGNVAASHRLNPRPLYLVFENAGREAGLDQMDNFERVRLPFLNRLKAFLFSPTKITVYRSAAGAK